jgi:ATP-dependent DNA helicase RecG
MRLFEQIGSGISRMRDLMKEEGLTPTEFNTDGMFTVAFKRPFDFERWENHLSEKNIIILKSIHENQEIKKSALKQLTDFSPSTLDYNIEILKKTGLLELEGTKAGLFILRYINPKLGE